MKKPGIVYLVGAGPGDPGLLTLRGAEVLRRADVVVSDSLVGMDLLRLVPGGAELVCRSKGTGGRSLSQDQLNQLLIARARAGKVVVRLKGGDPYVFGRGGEEAAELAGAGVPFEVVPGVSSFSAVPNYAGVPVTHRDFCSSFTVVTGHQDPADEDAAVDWSLLAKAGGTKILLMAVEHIQAISARLVAGGMSPDTPVAMVRWGTTGRQESIEGTLADIGSRAAERGFKAPAVTIIGDVVKLRGRLNWFEQRPLFGCRVVVTRSREQAPELSDRLRERGAEVIEIPVIKTAPPANKDNLKDALLGLREYNWIVFTSPNGVTVFFDYFFKAFDDLRDLGGLRIAAVGPGTAARVRALHLKVDAMPEAFAAAQIAAALARCESLENLRILLARAEVANPELPRALEAKGAIVDDVALYRTVADSDDPAGAAGDFLERGADWITFASGSAVSHFHQRFDLPALLRKFPHARLASIGPETSKAIQSLGLSAHLEAKEHTIAALADALAERAARRR